MANFKKEFSCPDYSFSPDGDFPIYNIENGYADVVLEFDESETIELSGDFEVDSGKSTNTIPSKAVLTADGGRRVFEGVSAHSSTPELGVNAIPMLCASCGARNFSRFINEVLAGDDHGGKLDFVEGKSCREGQYPGRTTVAPTVLKKAGDKVLLTLNIRHSASLDRKAIEKAFDEYRDQYHYEYRIASYMDALEVNHKQRPFALMAETYEDWGYENRFVAAGGTSYAKAMKNTVTWGPCFPEDLSCAHQENERVGLSPLFRAMGIYTDYMYRIVSEEESLLDGVVAGSADSDGGEPVNCKE